MHQAFTRLPHEIWRALETRAVLATGRDYLCGNFEQNKSDFWKFNVNRLGFYPDQSHLVSRQILYFFLGSA